MTNFRMERIDEINRGPLSQEILDEGYRYANICYWSDVEPAEILSISPSGKTAKIRKMDAELVQAPAVVGVGGFVATFENHGQEWKYSSNEDYPIYTIRLTKKGWSKKGTRISINNHPVKFHDYNF